MMTAQCKMGKGSERRRFDKSEQISSTMGLNMTIVLPETMKEMATTTEELALALATYLMVNMSSVTVLSVEERVDPAQEVVVSMVVEVPASMAEAAAEALKSGAWLAPGSPPVGVEEVDIVFFRATESMFPYQLQGLALSSLVCSHTERRVAFIENTRQKRVEYTLRVQHHQTHTYTTQAQEALVGVILATLAGRVPERKRLSCTN